MGEPNPQAMTAIDRFSELTGRAVAWLTLLMVIVTFLVVVMRYVFDAGLIWLQESVVWMHAAVFMLGAAYTLQQDEHVRVDIFYRGMSAARKAWVDIIGVLLLLLPMCLFLAFEAWDFVAVSWAMQESSRESGGLPFPMVPLAKMILLLMPAMVALQGIALLLRSLRTLRRVRSGADT